MDYFDQSDVEQNKTIVLLTCILILFVPILFFLPLVACGNSAYGRFYANQCLLLFIGYIISIVTAFILVGGLIGIIVFIFAIMNAVNASKGLRKGIPLVGGIEIIK
ncbi:MAG: hypothetical protein J1F11_12955 [Oscillospiraceae bacterium]|nr:hypothetical protein [Oscillospiraceae bacterium]